MNRRSLSVAFLATVSLSAFSLWLFNPHGRSNTISTNTGKSTTEPISPVQEAAKPEFVKPIKPIDRWVVTKSENELDGTKSIAIDDGVFYLRCSPKWEAYIVPLLPQMGHRLEADANHGQVLRWRRGDEVIVSDYWAVSADYTALFLPQQTLWEVLYGPPAKPLIVEYQPEYTTKRTLKLDLNGMRDATEAAGCSICQLCKR